MAKLPFAEQINYHRAKLNLPTESYADILGEEHDHAFVVAGANRLDMLADFRAAVDKAIIDGTTLEEFRKDFDSIVAKYGWDYKGGRNWRSRTIYDTNLYGSYQAGRYEQQREMAKLKPYWEYRHRAGQKDPREEHEAWHGLILHCDDPWWQTHYPINAYNCKCSVFAHSKGDLERKGLKVGVAPPIEYETQIIGKNSDNPRAVQVPKGLDAGFDRIPGSSRNADPTQFLFDKASVVPPLMASRVMQSTLQIPEVRKLLNQEVAAMVDRVEAAVAKAHAYQAAGTRGYIGDLIINKSIGVLPAEIIDALAAKGIELRSSVISLLEADIYHALRPGKDALPADFWRNIVEYISKPEAIYFDKTKAVPTLLYIIDVKDKGKVILKLEDLIKVQNGERKQSKMTLNHLRSGKPIKWDKKMRESFMQYDLLYGGIE
ncbi:phage minor head protein [Suttonella indologenes]|uniref:Phage Mu protein F like protein n=1 Tax=Suttonella indologenes TaxID=13276 RepID=A0A380MYM0_9GAMM|nr:phage minor head protein [Suttonella indologenes]SUO97655.1 Phage Mu protein F like protein [Suttonella indologenes]